MSPNLTFAIKRLNYFNNKIDDLVKQCHHQNNNKPGSLRGYVSAPVDAITIWYADSQSRLFKRRTTHCPLSCTDIRFTVIEAAHQAERTVVEYVIRTGIDRTEGTMAMYVAPKLIYEVESLVRPDRRD